MKILLIGPGKLKYMPYAHFYLDIIDRNTNEVHLAYWNRDTKEEDYSRFNGIHLHEFSLSMQNDEPLLTKLWYTYRFSRFCKKLIKKHKYDKLIILHTIPGVMLCHVLFGEYSNKYILDYRDSTYETLGFFKKLVGNMVKHSICTFVSSDGFRNYLPKEHSNKIYTSHNILMDSIKHREYEKKQSNTIRVSFWGFIRHIGHNKLLISRLANDERFELHYYGREQKDALELKKYVQVMGIKNVFFHGEYNPEDRYEFIKKTDIIHNTYNDRNMMLDMGNKYYDGVIFRIPQLCMLGAYMAEACLKYNVGTALNPNDESFADNLYKYYIDLDKTSFEACCDNELDRIMKEYIQGTHIINQLINQ